MRLNRVDRFGRARLGAAALTLAAFFNAPAEAQRSRDFIVEAPSSGARLVGTLTLPGGPGPHAAALIVSPSGPHGRDEARTGGRHFARLAAALAEAGVASLRLDNRGVGGSANEAFPEWRYAWTPRELAVDATAALTALGAAPEVDAARVGLIGFSDGAGRAALVASARPEEVAFTVLLSASGVSAGENLRAQQVRQAATMGLDGAALERVDNLLRTAVERIITGADRDASVEAAAEAMVAMGMGEEQASAAARNVVDNLSERGVRAYLGFDPAPALAGVECTTLVINGAADDRLASADAAPTLLDALNAAERTDVTYILLGGLDHFLEGPSPAEPPTFDDRAMRPLIEWVASRVQRGTDE